ncbi:uncharacterized protein LOC125061341 [Pieris napi]|uniref:uncharacterized protein LOC125061341 n=1 Tax=Pieris napi TaxID=78633 RepID=UPI001FBA8DC4|nr:uncharacterized protein LOC125061341 [Pieris napi]
MPRGKTLKRQSRKMVYDVYKFMAKEAEEGVGNLKAVQKRTAAATQTSLITVKRIVKEANSSRLLSVFRTPGKKRPRSNPVTGMDDFDKGVIKRCIHNFHVTNKELPTIKKIKNKLRDDIGYQGSATSLRKIIKDLGFRWRKTENNRKILIEKTDIRLKRIKYIKELGKYRQEGCPIIYTDESYVHSTHTTSKGWSDLSSEGLKKTISKGQRDVIVHAGSEDGFVPNALLMFKSGTKSGDYHDDMNFINYKKWLETQLIPNLPPNAVVVVDNASYHNKEDENAPTSNTKKAEMQSWLAEKGIAFTSDMLKSELYDIIKKHKESHKIYSIDKILQEHNHRVLRLPPYHPDLNPIEMAWAAIKGHVSSKNVKWNITRVMELVKEKVDQMGPNEWKALCEKTKKIENEYIENDHIIDDLTDQEIIIAVGASSDDSDSDTENSENSSDEDEIVAPQPSTSGTARDSGCHRTDEYISGVRFINYEDSDSDFDMQ